MEVLRNFKFRLYPTNGKEKKLNNTLEICRTTYNKILETKVNLYKDNKKSISCFKMNNLIKTWKIENIHSQILQDVSKRVDLSFKGFFRRVKTKQKSGFPRFKSYNRYNSFTFPQSGYKIVNENKLYLSKIGDIKINFHRKLEGKIKTCTIKK